MERFNRRNWLKSSLLLAAGAGMQSTKGFSEIILKDSSRAADELRARLNANENPYGPPPSVAEAIQQSIVTGNRYGHGDAAKLIQLIAKKEGVSPQHIMLGPGSTDLLEKTAITLFLRGGNVVSADPSYMSLMSTTMAIGADWKAVPTTKEFAHDLPAMEEAIDAQTKLIYICNPNNPTGSLTDANQLRDFCSRVSAKVPIFVDEAYLDFLDNYKENTMVSLVAEGKDIIIARTFSKIFGMAGLRIGYIVAPPERIKTLNSMVRGTMGLCVTSVRAAIASLENGNSFCTDCREWNKKARSYTTSQLQQLGY